MSGDPVKQAHQQMEMVLDAMVVAFGYAEVFKTLTAMLAEEDDEAKAAHYYANRAALAALSIGS